MKTEVKIPEVGESVNEALLIQWYRRDGDFVRKGEILFLIETDKVTLEVVAEGEGVLKILVPEGSTVPVGAVVATLESARASESAEAKPPPAATAGMPAAAKPEAQLAYPSVRALAQPEKPMAAATEQVQRAALPDGLNVVPSAMRLAQEKEIDLTQVEATGPGGRVTRGDVLLYLEQLSMVSKEDVPAGAPVEQSAQVGERPATPAVAEVRQPLAELITRKPRSRIRQRIAERLLTARQNTAMLTTFNEVDMSRVQAMRAQFREAYKAQYGVSLGIMSFFIKASVTALQEFPAVNAFLEGQDIVYHQYYHIGVAIGAERGLVVPVIRHADRLGFAGLEQAIRDYAKKLQENRLELSDLEGGTFTISSGGVYGSLLSTPILNTPQSGILGLHKIEDRPVAIGGEVVIRPMMYVALTYDHRIIDGREAVSFLKRIKECVENPERIMLEI
jgi:2-oxoglutarate dehydrogenase E2 component (dihydrolipoamide succinyltransferase)